VTTRADLRYAIPALLVVLVAATVLTLQLVERAGAGTAYCDRHALQAAQRAEVVTGSGTPVVVVGDSWSVGLGLERPAGSWPSRLPGRVTVAGFSGSGFSRTASPCGDESFGTRAAAIPPSGLVVVAGGLNDHDRSSTAITLGFARLMSALEGRQVVVLGPATAPSRASAVPRVDRLLARLAAASGVPYVATSDLRLPYLPDRLHLTAEGHTMFGDAVAGRLADRGLLG
jgi:acyl-CoA thioesterase-1